MSKRVEKVSFFPQLVEFCVCVGGGGGGGILAGEWVGLGKAKLVFFFK